MAIVPFLAAMGAFALNKRTPKIKGGSNARQRRIFRCCFEEFWYLEVTGAVIGFWLKDEICLGDRAKRMIALIIRGSQSAGA